MKQSVKRNCGFLIVLIAAVIGMILMTAQGAQACPCFDFRFYTSPDYTGVYQDTNPDNVLYNGRIWYGTDVQRYFPGGSTNWTWQMFYDPDNTFNGRRNYSVILTGTLQLAATNQYGSPVGAGTYPIGFIAGGSGSLQVGSTLVTTGRPVPNHYLFQSMPSGIESGLNYALINLDMVPGQIYPFKIQYSYTGGGSRPSGFDLRLPFDGSIMYSDTCAELPAPSDPAPVLPELTVTPTDSTATEAGLTTGTFRISRTGSTASNLTVYFTMGGTATQSSDYNTISSPAIIAAGSSYVDLTLTPIQDSLYEDDETALLTLSANAAYTLGSPGSATITILDEDDPPPSSQACASSLIAGGGNPNGAINVGEVQIWQDGTDLMVMYLIDDPDWCLKETHLHVATSLGNIPQTKIKVKKGATQGGNPIPGKFAYKAKHKCVTEYTYTIPLDSLAWEPGTDLYFAAHSVVIDKTSPKKSRTETAWADGVDFPGKNWATYFTCSTVEDSGPTRPTVDPNAPTWTKGAGVRYKGTNTGGEIYLGTKLGSGYPNRAESNYTWKNGTYDVTFSFDQPNNKITTSVSGPAGSVSLEYDFDTLLSPGCPVNDWDAMEIYMKREISGATVDFNNVRLNDYLLGDFTIDNQSWTVRTFDFSQSFTLTGQLAVKKFSGNENIKLEINVGCLTP